MNQKYLSLKPPNAVSLVKEIISKSSGVEDAYEKLHNKFELKRGVEIKIYTHGPCWYLSYGYWTKIGKKSVVFNFKLPSKLWAVTMQI